MSTFEELTTNLVRVQNQFSSFGACDTEPDLEIHLAMRTAIQTGVVELPNNWQLFTCSMDCREAEAALNAALLPLLEYVAEAGRIRKKVKDFCWRAY